MEVLDVENIRTVTIPDGSGAENLILTGDQNVIDLAYSVRWNISEARLFAFQIAEPEGTIREVAESAMRAVVSRVSLDEAIGAGRAEIEQNVEQAMQQILNDYGAGVRIQGVAISQSVPPAAVNEAFLQVSAAQQQAQSDLTMPAPTPSRSPPGAGWRGRVREDADRISRRAGSHPPPDVLRRWSASCRGSTRRS